METSELRLILDNCFTIQELQNILNEKASKHDLIEKAIDAIISEEDSGVQLTNRLDQESEKQREKIRSMTPRELKNSLSVEFLEPGRRLGLIVWALLRDDRLSARSLASNIATHFGNSSTPPSVESGADINVGNYPPEALEILDEISEEIDEDQDSYDENADNDTLIIDDSDEDVEMEQILAELEQEELDDEELEESDIELDIPDEEEDLDFMEEEPVLQAGESDEEQEDDLDSVFSISPGEEDDDEEFEIEFEDEDSDSEDETKLIEDDITQGMEEVDKLIASLNESEMDTDALNQRTIPIGGVEISLESLQRACERVFNEPVELVTDENLTKQDKIVVIGKRCGLYVLQGPRYKIEPVEPAPAHLNEPIKVSPNSLKAALSKVYDESIELVPDQELLNKGIVVFTGKETGLSLVNNSMTNIPMPSWAEGQLEDESSSTQQKIEEESKINEIGQRIETWEQQLKNLDERLSALETSSEQEDTDHQIADETVSLDDIESEELEPLPEEIPDIPEEETEEDQSKDMSGEIGEEELNLDDLDFGESEGEGEEQEQQAEQPQGTDDSEIDDLISDVMDEGIDDSLSEDFSEILPQEKSSDTQEESEESEAETSEGEFDLDVDMDEDDINLDDINLDDLEGEFSEEDIAGEEQSEDSSDEEDFSGDEEFDLDVLSELEKVESDTAKKVFNGDRILLLGGDQKHSNEYKKVVESLGGTCDWHNEFSNSSEDEINEVVDQADLIMTLSSDAITDPGILQATSYAQENNKRLFEHHSNSPTSVQKKLVQLVEEGKV